jgi:hypothetical protein
MPTFSARDAQQQWVLLRLAADRLGMPAGLSGAQAQAAGRLAADENVCSVHLRGP